MITAGRCLHRAFPPTFNATAPDITGSLKGKPTSPTPHLNEALLLPHAKQILPRLTPQLLRVTDSCWVKERADFCTRLLFSFLTTSPKTIRNDKSPPLCRAQPQQRRAAACPRLPCQIASRNLQAPFDAMSNKTWYTLQLKAVPTRYGLTKNAQTLLQALDWYHDGSIDSAELGRLVRLSPQRRTAIANTITKCAEMIKKQPAELKTCVDIIEMCTEILEIAGELINRLVFGKG